MNTTDGPKFIGNVEAAENDPKQGDHVVLLLDPSRGKAGDKMRASDLVYVIGRTGNLVRLNSKRQERDQACLSPRQEKRARVRALKEKHSNG